MADVMSYCFDAIEGHFLWEELPNQTVYILICTAIPSRVGVGKKELTIQGSRDSFVLGEFFTDVRRERMHAVRKGLEQRGHGV